MKIHCDPLDHFATRRKTAIPIHGVTKDSLEETAKQIGGPAGEWVKANNFEAGKGSHLVIPNENGTAAAVLIGIGDGSEIEQAMQTAKLARMLPAGIYEPVGGLDSPEMRLSWALGGYTFDRYSDRKTTGAKLAGKPDAQTRRIAQGVYIARDLINTPANDMGPEALEKAVRTLGNSHSAKVTVTKGDALLKKNFPMVHAVGRASAEAPRVIDLRWGKTGDRKITLVGKGVTFDTGGLNIKPGQSMALMKKDMGGAANVLGLAHMIMDAKLPVRLRVIIGAVENAISGNAFRPGDVLPSRKGITVEIGNTDAEGRLVLGDCLALGDEEKPDLMVDMATLTGAARVALGPDLPPFYTHDDDLATALDKAAERQQDPLWRMPLWPAYKSMLASKVADINHITSGGFAGSITAALFLSRFVSESTRWVHFDIFGWVPSEKPWSRVGGEAQGIRALFDVITSHKS